MQITGAHPEFRKGIQLSVQSLATGSARTKFKITTVSVFTEKRKDT